MNVETIEIAFQNTCVASRVALEGGLNDEKGERCNVVFSVLEALPGLGSKFSSRLISADGGVKSFLVTYQFGEYLLLVCQFEYFQDDWPFTNPSELCDWLNSQEKKILATAVILTN
jgi:hypothetical protein